MAFAQRTPTKNGGFFVHRSWQPELPPKEGDKDYDESYGCLETKDFVEETRTFEHAIISQEIRNLEENLKLCVIQSGTNSHRDCRHISTELYERLRIRFHPHVRLFLIEMVEHKYYSIRINIDG